MVGEAANSQANIRKECIPMFEPLWRNTAFTTAADANCVNTQIQNIQIQNIRVTQVKPATSRWVDLLLWGCPVCVTIESRLQMVGEAANSQANIRKACIPMFDPLWRNTI
jgi:hypothetical protein